MDICIYGKQDELNADVLFAFEHGARQAGIQTTWLAPRGNLVEPFDAVVVLGLQPRRKMIRDAYQTAEIPVFVLEFGHLLREEGVWQIGLDTLNWLPGKECDSDRFNSFELPLETPAEYATDILIVGQKPSDAQHGLNDMQLSLEIQKLVDAARSESDGKSQILYRPHPMAPSFQFVPKGIDGIAEGSMDHVWPTIGTVATYNSNVGNLALMKGCKVICNEVAQYAPVVQGKITREQYFARLAYTNWHINEIAEGKPFPFYLDVIAGDVNADGDTSNP